MRSFLVNANEVEKFAFIRDANYWYIASSGYDQAVWELIMELLESLKLAVGFGKVLGRCNEKIRKRK